MSRDHKRYLLFSFLFFFSLSLVYDIAVVENPSFNIYDFAMNLLSEFAGMIFTVLIFNEFLTQRDKIQLATRNRLFYVELERWLQNFTLTFSAPAEQYLKDLSKESLWSEATFEQILGRVQVDEFESSRQPEMPWYLFFSLQGSDLEKDCENLLARFRDTLDQQSSTALSYFLYDSTMLRSLSDIQAIYQADILLGHHRPKQLSNYYPCPTSADFANLAALQTLVDDNRKPSKQSERQRKAANIIYAIVFLIVFPFVGVKTFIDGNYLNAALFLSGAVLYLWRVIAAKRKKP